jgi:two-component system KDP operon response regulator KdpE
MKILVADDDPQLVRALRITLAAHGYDVVAAADGAAAVTLAAQAHPDIVLLDLGMPHLDGVQVIQALRGWSSAPIIVVSGRTGSADKVEALDSGADDYVTKPFQIDELLARLRALSRRTGDPGGDPVVSFGEVDIDLAAKAVTRSGVRVHLTPTEWRMLEFLARHPGALVTRQTLLKEIWGSQSVSDSGYLRLYMSQLRRKLEADPSRPAHLMTESGMGYRLMPDASSVSSPATGSRGEV